MFRRAKGACKAANRPISLYCSGRCHSPTFPFYQKLNEVLAKVGVNESVEKLGRPFNATPIETSDSKCLRATAYSGRHRFGRGCRLVRPISKKAGAAGIHAVILTPVRGRS